MRMLYSLLILAGLASCGNSSTYAPAPLATAAPVRATQSGLPRTEDYLAQRQLEAEQNRQVNRAMESSFGYGTARNGRMVSVAGTPMSLRVVNVRGYSFAVMQKTGVNWGGTTGRELFPQMIQAAQANTGCAPSGKVSMQRQSNGAHTRYSVHLNC